MTRAPRLHILTRLTWLTRFTRPPTLTRVYYGYTYQAV